jgi:uncharacterized hydrophobic protein (TIGR00271 family)
MAKKTVWLKASRERISTVAKEIEEGSQPEIRFYAMVTASALIACIGLIANSTAIIIGAMLVAPLMTPIFGISLALVRGNATLLGRAMRAEIIGVILTISIASLFSFLPLAWEVTPEMLARTKPTLLDLLVAVLAGFAGAYAMVDERLSPGLPGVAIATAIVPPLANTGLAAMGSFLLFIANFFSILLISSTIFAASGMMYKYKGAPVKEITRRFGVAAVGFIIVAGFLTYSLVGIVKSRYLTQSIKRVLSEELSKLYGTSMEDVIHDIEDNELNVLATVYTPEMISPVRVRAIQDALTEEVKMPARLILRNIFAKNMSAVGTTGQVKARDLEGDFLGEEVSSRERVITHAEQVIWERFSLHPAFHVMDVDLVRVPRGRFIVATVGSPRVLEPEEIQDIEDEIQERIQEKDLQLIIRFLTPHFSDSRGKLLYPWTQHGVLTPEKEEMMDQIESALKEEFKKTPEIFLVDVHFYIEEDAWNVLAETVGTRVMSTEELSWLEIAVSEKVNHALTLSVWYRAETVVTGSGYVPFEEFTLKDLYEREKKIEKIFSGD